MRSPSTGKVGEGRWERGETSSKTLFWPLSLIVLGMDLSANQDEEGDQEVFQVEMTPEDRKCAFRTAAGKYWNLTPSGGLQCTASTKYAVPSQTHTLLSCQLQWASARSSRMPLSWLCIWSVCRYPRSADTYFELEWCDGRVRMRAANGKYVMAKKNGQLAATVENAGQCLLWSHPIRSRLICASISSILFIFGSLQGRPSSSSWSWSTGQSLCSVESMVSLVAVRRAWQRWIPTVPLTMSSSLSFTMEPTRSKVGHGLIFVKQ